MATKTLAEILKSIGDNKPLNKAVSTVPISHTLKCWLPYFQFMRDGTKRFDLRSCEDRYFSTGQYILQREYCLDEGGYTGRWDLYYIQYVLGHNEVSEFSGIDLDMVILDLIHIIGN